MIVTIDGPAGSGKSTAARKLAARLEIPYLDTGAMYRTVTLAALQDGLDLQDEAALTRLAASLDYELDCRPTHVCVTLRGHDVTEAIRGLQVTEATRFIARSPGVRRLLVEKQREIGKQLGSMVTEGRDQGSVAFPHADCKFYLDASVERRAERRYHELLAEGESVTLEEVRRAVCDRDRSDSQRVVAPLVKPVDAVAIDTSELSINEVVERIADQLIRCGLHRPGRSGHAWEPVG